MGIIKRCFSFQVVAFRYLMPIIFLLLFVGFFSISAEGAAWDTYNAISTGQVWSFTTIDRGLSVDLAYEHLYNVMDKFHGSFDVYTNHGEGGNHFYPSGWMGDTFAISLDDNWETDCYAGTSCIKVGFSAEGNNWAAMSWQEPEHNEGETANGGYDLSGATKLVFRAKGDKGGERVSFFVGGATYGLFPDSLLKISTGYLPLTASWKEYTVTLPVGQLNHVITGFGWEINSFNNPGGATFYLDDIRYDKSRIDEVRFLVSYETLSSTDPGLPDRYLKNAGYIYDNALALIALARGHGDDLGRAKIIADAFVAAQDNDRSFTDGRLRNAYMSGDLTDHLTGKARLPGWWDPLDKKWYEDAYQVSTHTGNLAWAAIGLLEYHKKDKGAKYLAAAERLGRWIYDHTYDVRGAGGYTGGYLGWEQGEENPAGPAKILWKSTEHNLDVYAAFMRLYWATKDPEWRERALHAKKFVEAMWNGGEKHFWTGTLDDGVSINKSNIPVDIQAWAVMTLEEFQSQLAWAEDNCYTEIDGFRGFDFNQDRDGVWFEGTAQMAIAYQLINAASKADLYLAELQKAQASAANTNGRGIVAASHDGTTTGFEWQYFSRLHVASTAWYLFAETGYNPYWGTRTAISKGDINGDGAVNLEDVILALQIQAGMEPYSLVFKDADVNGDAGIGMEEIIYILQRSSGVRQK